LYQGEIEMFVDIIFLLVYVALTVGAGWLTIKALRAQKLWVKILGGLGAGLLTLVLAALTFLGGKGITTIYFPGADPASDLTVAGTPEQVARGEYLTNLSCIGCHSAVDAEGNPTEAQPLSGGWNIGAAEGFGFVGDLVTENLTPGGKLANYSDGELFRALRYGIDQDDHLLGFMPLLPYAQLSNADTEAIIAYLRSLPPVPVDIPTGDQLNFVGMVVFGAGLFGEPAVATDTVTAPPEGVTLEYGKYVATYGDCRSCHGPDMTGTPATSMFPAVPNPRPMVATWSEAQFMETMRSGVRPNTVPFPDTMPWQNASRMTDDDLAALYLYLITPIE
jgi:mono/diheme cytochrome c family protein